MFYERDMVFDALHYALPLKRTNDIKHKMHMLTDALRAVKRIVVSRVDGLQISTSFEAR